jgi:hypothetical protein
MVALQDEEVIEGYLKVASSQSRSAPKYSTVVVSTPAFELDHVAGRLIGWTA